MTEKISDNPPEDQDTCEIMNDFGTRCCRVVGHEGNCNFQSGGGMCNFIDSDELCTDCSVICQKTGASCFNRNNKII